MTCALRILLGPRAVLLECTTPLDPHALEMIQDVVRTCLRDLVDAPPRSARDPMPRGSGEWVGVLYFIKWVVTEFVTEHIHNGLNVTRFCVGVLAGILRLFDGLKG